MDVHHDAVGVWGAGGGARALVCEARIGPFRSPTRRPAAHRKVGAAAVATTLCRADSIVVTSCQESDDWI